MAPNPRVVKAFRAMREIGITEEKVKPVLKNLLKLYEKNWELIEGENYRALADAIFESEENEAAEQKKKFQSTERNKALEEDTQALEELQQPLKRLRRFDGQATPSHRTLPEKPKLEVEELAEAYPQSQSKAAVKALPEPDNKNARNESQSASTQPLGRNKGKQTVSPKASLIAGLSSELTQRDTKKRAESDLNNPQTRLKDKGKEPLIPQAGPRELRPISERQACGVRLKEPKVEPGIVDFPAKKTVLLIKPKDEPYADNVPLAVIQRESFRKGDTATEDGAIRIPNGIDPLPFISEKANDRTRRSKEIGGNAPLASTLEEPTTNLELASSSFGEVKVSLSISSSLSKPNFHNPGIDALVKTMEDKCMKSYHLQDSNFSLMHLMRDLCDCFFALGSEPKHETQPGIGAIQPLELSKRCFASNAVVTNCTPLDGDANAQEEDEACAPREPALSPTCKGVDSCENKEANIDKTDSHCLEMTQPHPFNPAETNSLKDAIDIAKGQERVIISLANEINNDPPPSFHYIPKNAVFQNAYMNFSLARIGDDNCCTSCSGDCLSSSYTCACALQTGGEFAYTSEGLVKEELLRECISMNRDPKKHCLFYCKECPLERSKNGDVLEPCKGHLVRKFIKECWWKCGCTNQCGNRVVQRGISRKLQVFMTSGGKGWGLRTLEELPKGAFVCEYVGEVLTNAELYDRVSRSSNKDDHSYPVLLDADWGAESKLKDEEALCLDATFYGNVGRFINHRCFDSTLVEIPVEVETPDHHYYHLAFFTTRKVRALEELTWDYGIDFDDHDHPVKAFKCRCGSKFCRNIKRPSRSRSGSNRRCR